MLRMSKALTLLPADRIIEGFEVVVSEARLFPNIEIAERYISYFQKKIGWNVLDRKTFVFMACPEEQTIDQEIFHRHLNTIMQSPQPGIWHFTKTLIKIEQEYGTRYERMQQRPALRARRRTYVQLDGKISAACERLAQSRISVREFLCTLGIWLMMQNEDMELAASMYTMKSLKLLKNKFLRKMWKTTLLEVLI
ncbi:uncharacterized protein LOC132948802 [Metopolophium dirhodum]|uniref:uncharacterized protein LOC132948802 n=1 Tax=Metopolophium dirhodum TaxID=44670 RepID=UPI0029904293|nr:uncharacterized protein LOC132948802 [Metopolophium dirhodum]